MKVTYSKIKRCFVQWFGFDKEKNQILRLFVNCVQFSCWYNWRKVKGSSHSTNSRLLTVEFSSDYNMSKYPLKLCQHKLSLFCVYDSHIELHCLWALESHLSARIVIFSIPNQNDFDTERLLTNENLFLSLWFEFSLSLSFCVVNCAFRSICFREQRRISNFNPLSTVKTFCHLFAISFAF